MRVLSVAERVADSAPVPEGDPQVAVGAEQHPAALMVLVGLADRHDDATPQREPRFGEGCVDRVFDELHVAVRIGGEDEQPTLTPWPLLQGDPEEPLLVRIGGETPGQIDQRVFPELAILDQPDSTVSLCHQEPIAVHRGDRNGFFQAGDDSLEAEAHTGVSRHRLWHILVGHRCGGAGADRCRHGCGSCTG